MVWARLLQAKLGAYEGICSIQQSQVAALSGKAVGRVLFPSLWCLSFRRHPSHPAGSSVVKELAFEGGREAAIPIQLEGIWIRSQKPPGAARFLGSAVSSPSFPLKLFQLPGMGRDAIHWGALSVQACGV